MSPTEAIQEMIDRFLSAWDASSYPVVYSDIGNGDSTGIPTGNVEWARVTILHADGAKTSLTNPSTMKSRYIDVGVITIQVFAPQGKGRSMCYELLRPVQLAFSAQDNTACVSYSNQRLKEANSSGGFAQVNFIADFQYEDVR